jgi:hypothetical protein
MVVSEMVNGGGDAAGGLAAGGDACRIDAVLLQLLLGFLQKPVTFLGERRYEAIRGQAVAAVFRFGKGCYIAWVDVKEQEIDILLGSEEVRNIEQCLGTCGGIIHADQDLFFHRSTIL